MARIISFYIPASYREKMKKKNVPNGPRGKVIDITTVRKRSA